MTPIITFNLSGFEKLAKRMQASVDQVPYALARSLNDAAEVTRKHLCEDVWPAHVHARNKSLMKASLTTRGNRATKKNLRVAIIDKLDHANLAMHADGGTRVPRGSRLALPNTINGAVKRLARGAVRVKPKDVTNSFVLNGKIYQRYSTGKGKNRVNKRRVMYTLKSKTTIKADVPFRKEFRDKMTSEVRKAFLIRIRQAMATRK
jgi:hypothetical protein